MRVLTDVRIGTKFSKSSIPEEMVSSPKGRDIVVTEAAIDGKLLHILYFVFPKDQNKQLWIYIIRIRKHSSRMCTVHFSDGGGGCFLTEPLPKRNMGPGSQTGSDIIETPQPHWHNGRRF